MSVAHRDFDLSVEGVSELASLAVVPQEPLTVDRVLRRLEVVRQRLAVRWCGTAGAFSGYDTLELTCEEPIISGVATFSARVVSAHEQSHTVELVATLTAVKDGQPASSPRVLARGEGRSLHIRC